MRPAEELRYLVLAIQREGNRLFAADLRPIGVTPSQAEVIRVLHDHQPLTLLGLGELLVCETGSSPSRLVDRLVTMGMVQRDTDATDRRQVTLSLTAAGQEAAARIAVAEERLYRTIDEFTDGTPVSEALVLLRALAGAFPAGEALARRAERAERAEEATS